MAASGVAADRRELCTTLASMGVAWPFDLVLGFWFSKSSEVSRDLTESTMYQPGSEITVLVILACCTIQEITAFCLHHLADLMISHDSAHSFKLFTITQVSVRLVDITLLLLHLSFGE